MNLRAIFALALVCAASAAHALSSASVPTKFPIPWANSASGSFIRTIPTASQIGVQNCAASLTDGFPPLTFQPVVSGGCAPFGSDFNGILKQVTQWSQWFSAGGPISYDGTFSSAIGGYPLGATVQSASRVGCFWTATTNNNTTNPDSGGAGWVNSCSLNPCLSYEHDFGAVAGGPDNSAALAAAINAVLTAGGGCLSIGPGKFTHNSPVTPSNFPNAIASLRIVGAGKDATILTWPNAGNGLTLNMVNPANEVHISDLSITTGATNPSGGTGLALNQTTCVGAYGRSTFVRIAIRGDDNFSTNYWFIDASITKVSGTVWDSDDFKGALTPAGTAISIAGATSCFAIDHTVSHSLFEGVSTALNFGQWTQNVAFAANTVNSTAGVVVAGSLAGTLGRLYVGDNLFNCGATSVSVGSAVSPLVVVNNTVAVQASQTGIFYNTVSVATIRGNTVTSGTASPATNNGIVISGASSGSLVSGNALNELTNGIVLQGGSTVSNIQSNLYVANTCGVLNGTCAYTNTPSLNTIGGGTP